ncbi:ATP-binding protein [Algoriphagus sediminis]|uniref:histidine kinase n=1 Tax=Algoriphagus sediminis TaxID=3057113 RepID=A0ABT7Y7W1_9BACT|nr:ATP-binding protein [Algoriphagus sediminis]MDN3202587.1 ATP-binding protein [Algoriphagus sediminis]
MSDKGVNSTFKKIIYESSEMVFLADDTYPYTIFYGNDLFENAIGEKLEQRNLVGLGLDVNSYIFKEELIINHNGQEFTFSLELPHENDSNYFLFYKGKKLEDLESPSKEEAVRFIADHSDSIGIGEYEIFTFVNAATQSMTGYSADELVNKPLKEFVHPEDWKDFSKLWKKFKKNQKPFIAKIRVKKASGEFEWLNVRVSFAGEKFYMQTFQKQQDKTTAKEELIQNQLIQNNGDLTEVGRWVYDRKKKVFELDELAAKIFNSGKRVKIKKSDSDNVEQVTFKRFEKKLLKKVKTSSLELGLKLSGEVKLGVQAAPVNPKLDESNLAGIVWNNEKIIKAKEEIAFLQAVFMDSPEAMILIKSSGEILMVNKEAKQMFGLWQNEDPKHILDLDGLVHETDSINSWIQTLLGNGEERFSTLKTDQNDSLTIGLKSRQIKGVGEEVYAISMRNITEKVSLERSLEDSTEFLMNLTDQVPGGLYQMVLSNDGQIRFAFLSKGIGSVLGLSSPEIENIKDIGLAMANVHPSDLPNVVMTSVASAKKVEPWQCQFRVKAGDDFKWVMGAARPQKQEDGAMIWYGYLTDISEQKEFEAKLDDAKKAAEKANQIKSDFLSMISHELRTPLNAISGSVYSLLQESPSDYQKNALNTINFAVDNLIIMINDLLDFQKIEAGKLHIENAEFNLSELLNQIVKGLTFHARDSENKLSLDLDSSLDIVVKGDKTRISQILNNLITNALKFTHKGLVSVKVEEVKRTKDTVSVYFEVKDNGIGIAPENQEKIFGDFDQVKPSFNKKYGGTGLGLSITKKLLNILGSDIHLISAVGEGSKFYFELEFELDNSSKKPTVITPDLVKIPDTIHLLMAEDNEVNALVLGKIIKKWGYTYDRVVNGKECIDILREKTRKYDCVLMDIQMPIMNGFEATKIIKEEFEIPVIALTAAAKLEIIEQIRECKFDGFVAKPIDAAELHSSIKEVVSKFYSRA